MKKLGLKCYKCHKSGVFGEISKKKDEISNKKPFTKFESPIPRFSENCKKQITAFF